MSPIVFGTAFAFGAGALALWTDVRFPRLAPEEMRGILMHTFAAFVVLHVVAGVVGPLASGGPANALFSVLARHTLGGHASARFPHAKVEVELELRCVGTARRRDPDRERVTPRDLHDAAARAEVLHERFERGALLRSNVHTLSRAAAHVS